MVKEHITSDLHFLHKTIFRHDYPFRRQWNNVDEMNEGLIDHWNTTVDKHDIVWVLGDVSLGNRNETREILYRLNGIINLIPGNHDQEKISVFKDRCTVLPRMMQYRYDKVLVEMCHYPIEDWYKIHHGYPHFHGHTHGSLPHPGRRLDVGFDVHGRILSFKEAFDMVMAKPIVCSSSHHQQRK